MTMDFVLPAKFHRNFTKTTSPKADAKREKCREREAEELLDLQLVHTERAFALNSTKCFSM